MPVLKLPLQGPSLTTFDIGVLRRRREVDGGRLLSHFCFFVSVYGRHHEETGLGVGEKEMGDGETWEKIYIGLGGRFGRWRREEIRSGAVTEES